MYTEHAQALSIRAMAWAPQPDDTGHAVNCLPERKPSPWLKPGGFPFQVAMLHTSALTNKFVPGAGDNLERSSNKASKQEYISEVSRTKAWRAKATG
jgi:hypothetical protein